LPAKALLGHGHEPIPGTDPFQNHETIHGNLACLVGESITALGQDFNNLEAGAPGPALLGMAIVQVLYEQNLAGLETPEVFGKDSRVFIAMGGVRIETLPADGNQLTRQCLSRARRQHAAYTPDRLRTLERTADEESEENDAQGIDIVGWLGHGAR